MSEQHTKCPACGKPVVFLGSFSMSAVCDGCGTIVVRPGFDQTVTGQNETIAAPDENDSPLELGMKGYYQGHHFEIRGVVRLGHDAGGFWEEWYLLFDDGRWGWLAEAQQHFYLTFAVEIKSAMKQAAKIPLHSEVRLEERFLLRTGEPPMTVAEKGIGHPLGARGEIPYALAPSKNYPYIDLSGPAGRFATIDYGETPPTLYFGRAVALGDLHLPHKAEDLTHDPRHVEAVHATCPHCRATLILTAPHKTVRVGCTACGSLLDADDGRLQLAAILTAGVPKLHVPIGAKGPLDSISYTVIGYLKRCLKSDKFSTWDEYLLYNSQVGYRWLTCSDDHWYFVESVPPGSVELKGKHASYAGKLFAWHEQDTALVSCVLGEFYWKVSPGEQVWMTDFLRAPEMLSREITHGGPDSGELSWSRAVYVSEKTVEKAFGLQQPLRRPSRPAPGQPSSNRRLYALWALMAGLTIVLAIFFQFHHRNQRVFNKSYLLPAVAHGNSGDKGGGGDFAAPAARPPFQPGLAGTGGTGGANSGSEEPPIFFSDPFEVRDHENLEIRVRVQGANFWLGLDGDLVDEKTGVVQEFSLPVEYYEGVSEGEAWTEGSREASAFISALPAGQYTLRIAGQHEPPLMPLTFEVSVYEGVARTKHFLLALLAVSLIPAFVLLLQAISAQSRMKQKH